MPGSVHVPNRARSCSLVFLLALAVSLVPRPSHATIDICAVNAITGQAHVFDEDDYMGIGWKSVGETACQHFDAFVAASGFTMTQAPHRIEQALVLALASGVAFLLYARRRRQRTKLAAERPLLE
jgi:hypothetical protein